MQHFAWFYDVDIWNVGWPIRVKLRRYLLRSFPYRRSRPG